MKKERCICCSISILLAIIGIVVLILYFTLGSGDNGGNNVNIGDNGSKGKKEGGDNNIIQKTSQGGVHILECHGNLHVNWKALLAVGAIILAILITKWAIQHNWCKIFKSCRKGNKKKHSKENDKYNKGDIEMQYRGKPRRESERDMADFSETHNLTSGHSDRQTVSPRLTQTSDIQTVSPRLATEERRMAPLHSGAMEAQLCEGLTTIQLQNEIKLFRTLAFHKQNHEKPSADLSRKTVRRRCTNKTNN